MKNERVNWRAMQIPPKRDAGKPTAWLKQGDVNVKAMTMGSWKASVSNGGAKLT